MSEVLASVSNREIAAVFWLCILTAWVVSKRGSRSALVAVIQSFFQPLIIIPLLLAAAYAAGEIYVLEQLNLWSTAHLKTTVLWLVTFAFVSMFQLVSIQERRTGLMKITRDILTVTGLLVFITELYSFPLLVELAAFPVVTFIVLAAEMAKHKPEHASAASLLGCVATLIGFTYFGFSLWQTADSWHHTATWDNALELVIPILLSIGFLPFLYAWRAYVAYSETFSGLSVLGLPPSLVPRARWLAFTRIRGDLDLLERWRKAIQIGKPQTQSELTHSLVSLFALRDREASPPPIKPEEGWSPYSAIRFLADFGFDTGYYHKSFDEEWFASSPMREIGAGIFPNNAAYYVSGTENAATDLRLKLNINEPASSNEAEDMFIVYCMHLLERAVGAEAVGSLKTSIASLRNFDTEIPFGSVSLSREDFVGGLKGGYSRIFAIRAGTSIPGINTN